MRNLYDDGTVRKVGERLTALSSARFDDDSLIEVFLFGENSHVVNAQLGENNYVTFDKTVITQYPLEDATHYAGVMEKIIARYKSTDLPVYVFFITDGDNQDAPQAEQSLRRAASQGIFWQFVGLGKDFSFLASLEKSEVGGNSHFFALDGIDIISEEELFKRMVGQSFCQWLSKRFPQI